MNDLDDFKIPYRIVGKQDYEVLKSKYLKLHNLSKGVIIRYTQNR